MAGVYPSSYTLKVGLQPIGSFREILINEDFVQGVWPLSELVSTRAKDISGQNNHGTYSGSGAFRGKTVDLPEGAIGSEFDGGGWVQVPNNADSNLSLAGGSMDIIFLMKTTTNDLNTRYIVRRYDTVAGSGYEVTLSGGKIGFTLFVPTATVIFALLSATVSDGAWHLVHCCYEPEANRVRIFVDGVQSGSSGTGTTEAPETAVDLFIGGKSGAVSTDRYIGSLAFVMVGREGNPDLSPALQAVRSWTTINADLRSSVAPIAWRRGISGSGVLDNTASPGSLTFALDNTTQNSGATLGYYSPGHETALGVADARSGWRLGIPVQFGITTVSLGYVAKFTGQVTAIQPTGNERGQRSVAVTCSDWMDIAARTFLSAAPLVTNQRSDVALKTALDQLAGRSPHAVDIGVGLSTFPMALDIGQSDSETLLTEMQRITQSEGGYCYVRGDGTLVWEGRGVRQTDDTPDAFFDETYLSGISASMDMPSLVNVVRVIVTPRDVDAAATTVLYRLEVSEQSQGIAPGESVVFEGGYSDPNGRQVRVGGADMVTPVSGTDYGFFTNSDGTGVNISSSLTVTSELGGNSFRVTFTNAGTTFGYLWLSASTAFQLRGKGIYHYTPIAVERRDEQSIRRHGPRTVQLDLQYESSRTAAESRADYLLAMLSAERTSAKTLTIPWNNTGIVMNGALTMEPGSRVGVAENLTAVTTLNEDFLFGSSYVNEESGTYADRGIVTTTLTLTPTSWLLAGEFDASAFDEDLVFGY